MPPTNGRKYTKPRKQEYIGEEIWLEKPKFSPRNNTKTANMV